MTRPPLGHTRLLVPGRDLSWKEFFTRLVKELDHDAVDDVAATVTFYCMLALFPFLLFVVGVLSKIVSWETIDDVVRQVSTVMPREVTTIVSERLTALKTQPATGLLTFSFIGALWSASAGVASLIPALDHAYDVVETRPFWKRRLLALGATVGVGVVSIVASLIALAVPALSHWIGGSLGELLLWVRLPIAGAIIMVTWALLYMFLPNVKPRFQPVTPGSIVGVLLWVAASWGFSQYVSHFGSYEATYGALGSVIVLLLWMWVSAMALMLGAEINKILMPVEDKKDVDTHVANMPETAKQQEAAPEIAPETHVGEHAEIEAVKGEKPEVEGGASAAPPAPSPT
ncbi:MAG: Ribonuclease [Myxococcaceae bacterium]|nr:Ribonuclease [Myxococcaceae bacterium]